MQKKKKKRYSYRAINCIIQKIDNSLTAYQEEDWLKKYETNCWKMSIGFDMEYPCYTIKW